MNSATLIVLLVVNLWGIVSNFGIVRDLRYAGKHTPVGSVRVMRLIMYFTFACVVFALWNRHVHFVF